MIRKVVFSVCVLFSVINSINTIIAGKFTKINEFPYIVSLHYNDKHICSGVLINFNTIVTAASCVYGLDQHHFSIHGGSTYYEEGKTYKITNIIIHPNYNKASKYDFNIALLKTPLKIPFSYTLQPIVKLQDQEIPAGTVCRTAGWGITEQGTISDYIRSAEVHVISNEECNVYFNKYNKYITSNIICGKTNRCAKIGLNFKRKHDADSGGPLVCKINGKDILVGIIYLGPGFINLDSPGIYTKISKTKNWIENEYDTINYCPKL